MADIDRWQLVQKLFAEASALGAEERADFLARACSDDTGIAEEVSALLAHDVDISGDDRFSSAIEREDTNLIGDSAASAWRGKRIGAYRIVDKIAEGGMGAVYLADRDDKAYEQKVAIKLISKAGLSKLLSERFRSERQILANLDHPNIARLIDGGEDGDGTPYLVMEYVDGTMIDAYCDQHRLTVGERLKLFVQVCDAVQYAHQNLIIHRDIKPSNILVTEEGVPKLLDFGIAKPIAADLDELTRVGQRIMTPKHASPEQWRGEKITTASDVYALGVLLYELLSGSFPFDMSSSSAADVERIVAEATPPSMSDAAIRPVASTIDKAVQLSATETASRRRLSKAKLVRRLRGDLDAIALKAMSKKPTERYATARQLAEDVKRHLNNLPVDARSHSTAYRWFRLLVRFRTAAVIGTAVVIAAVAAGSFHSLRLAAERDRAQDEAERANKVAVLLAEILEAAGPAATRGTTVSAEQLLDHGTERIRRDLADEPLMRADLLAVIGRTYRSLGLYQESHDLVVESLDIRERQLQSDDSLVAESLYELGYTSYELGNFEESLHAHERSLALYEQILGAEPNERVAASLREVGHLHENLDRFDLAENFYTASLDQLRQLHPDGSQELALSQTDLAGILFRTGRYAEAEPLVVGALKMRRALLGDVHPDVAQGLNNVGFFYLAWGDILAAEDYMRDSVALRNQLYGEDSSITALAKANLGYLLQHRGALEESQAHLDRACQISTAKLGVSHRSSIRCGVRQMDAMVEAGKHESAILLGTRLLALAEASTRDLAYVRSGLGRTYLAADDFETARGLLTTAREEFIATRGPEHLEVAKLTLRLADVEAAAGQPENAIRTYEEFLNRFADQLLATHPEISRAHFRVGELHLETGKDASARTHLNEAVAIYEKTQLPTGPRLAKARAAALKLAGDDT